MVLIYSIEPSWEWSPWRGSSREWWNSPSSLAIGTASPVGISSPSSPPLDAIDLNESLKHLWKNLELRISLIEKKSPFTTEFKICLLSCEQDMQFIATLTLNEKNTYSSWGEELYLSIKRMTQQAKTNLGSPWPRTLWTPGVLGYPQRKLQVIYRDEK